MFGELGKAIGSVVGTLSGVSLVVVAEILDLPLKAVQEAVREGCKTYDEIREFCKRG